MISFETNHPIGQSISKLLDHFLKRNRKLKNAGELAEPRLGMFMELLELSEMYKREKMV